MKLTQKYTDDYYASAYEIKSQLNVSGIHLILDEIDKYREQYRIYFYFENKKHSIDLIPKIKDLLNTYYVFNDASTLHPFIQIFLFRNHHKLCKQCIEYYDLPFDMIHTFNYIYSFEEDITKSFIEWLEHLSHFKCIKMLEYEYKIKQLSLKQRSFLLNHDDYFDIETYQNENQFSYETARLHLSFLYKQKIISRHKVGKKYVYRGMI